MPEFQKANDASRHCVLDVEGLILKFGGLTALDDVSFQINGGEILGLIGPNGAGKTTLFNAVTGVYRPTRGDIRFRGESVVGLKPHRIARLGIARTFQNIRPFTAMTALETYWWVRMRSTPPACSARSFDYPATGANSGMVTSGRWNC